MRSGRGASVAVEHEVPVKRPAAAVPRVVLVVGLHRARVDDYVFARIGQVACKVLARRAFGDFGNERSLIIPGNFLYAVAHAVRGFGVEISVAVVAVEADRACILARGFRAVLIQRLEVGVRVRRRGRTVVEIPADDIGFYPLFFELFARVFGDYRSLGRRHVHGRIGKRAHARLVQKGEHRDVYAQLFILRNKLDEVVRVRFVHILF